MNIKKNFFAPWASGLGATRRAAMLLLVMMLTTAMAWAQTTGGTCGDVTWSLTGESPDYTLTISGTGAMADYDVPEECPWYSYVGQINEVVIEDGVTTIGNLAFFNCQGLTSVTIPASVTSIGHCAFEGCSDLTTVTIPASVTSIGERAFENCQGLTSIEIPASVESIGDLAFLDCSGLTSVTIYAPSCRLGGTYAFYNCNNLANIYVFSDLVDDYQGAENWSAYASKIKAMPNPNGKCGDNVRWVLTGESPDYTLTISGTGAMADYNDPAERPWHDNAADISNVVIENGVTSIGALAFSSTGLTSIEIPASVTSIGECAFLVCQYLTSITFAEGSQLESIGRSAFSSSRLTSIEIPAGVTSIGESAFFSCGGLTSVSFAEGSQLESIGDNAFRLCSNLTSITIPASVTSIGSYVFQNCDLASMAVADGNTVYDSRNGCNAIIERLTNKLIIGCKNSTIPASVTSIGDYAFSNTGLTSIEIPASVTSIGAWAFFATGLTSIEIPASVTSIGIHAFQNCTSLATVTVYAPSCTLGENAFANCNKLANIYVFSDLVDTYKAAENWSAYAGKITALPTVATSYVDASGTLYDGVEAVPLNNAMTTLPAGTYVVNSDVAYTGTVTLSGDVTLILADGKTMSVTTTDNHECIYADGHSLHIYGQTQGTGTLSAQIQGNADVIYIEDGTLGIHGGNVNATVGSTETSTAIFLIRHNAGDAFIIDRGTVTANGNTGYGIQGYGGNYCINGGQVIATGASKGISVSTLISSYLGVLILSGGTITASSFYTASEAAGGKYAGSIKVADGHIYYDEDENSYTAGTLTSEQITAIAGKTLRPVTGVTLTKDGSNVSATFDGTSTTTVSIPVDVEVNSVIYNRTFTASKPSTVMLPFSKNVSNISGGTFYTFGGVQKENNTWVATMNEVTTGTLTANTPYLFMPTGTSLTFTGGATLNTNGGGNRVTAAPGSHWKFKGTYEYMKWTTDTSDPDYSAEREAEIGRAYGFAGVAKTGIEVGDFVKVASGAKIRPMGCYLLWSDTPNASRAAARSAATEELPQSITVRLVSADGEVTGIGEIDTKTGEMTFDSEAWYTLNGVRLSGKPTKKGLYIMNGKKVVVK